MKTACCSLIATRNRWEFLTTRSLPSVRCQSYRTDLVVVVNDGVPFSVEEENQLQDIVSPLRLVVISNSHRQGAAGAWNSGLEVLSRNFHSAFVAILDDDDEWDPHHLEVNIITARKNQAQVIVSGLRMIKDGVLIPRKMPSDFTDRQFLLGNPGWQGTNTFVDLSALQKIGGFRDALRSMNDRDLAIRLLRLPGLNVGYTKTWSACWYLDSNRTALSSRGGKAKLEGLRYFWKLYGEEMSPRERIQFFMRAQDVFDIASVDIMKNHDYSFENLSPKGSMSECF
jgi:glycosyltransferase involved in cell wall biosynthesis